MEKFTISNGMAIRYAAFGKIENPAILLLHGYLESIEVFETLAGQLGKSHHIIMLDLPGSGMSDWAAREVIPIDLMADVAADILNKVGINSCTVVGHSMGGYVALSLAQRHSDKVKKLVLLHSSPNPDTEERKVNRQREIDLILAGKKEMLANVNPSRGFAACNVKRCDEIIEELHDQVMFTEDEAIVATLRGMMERVDRTEFFAGLGKPKLMIFGDDDNYISKDAACAMIEKYPSAESVFIEKAGHMSFVEQPQKVIEVLEAFVSR